MAGCPDSAGGVWAYFPDEVYDRSKTDIAERLEDVFYRPFVDKSGKPSGEFSNWQTDLLLTGKLEFSKKKVYGIHGGFAYLFIVATGEEIGITRIHDLHTGLITEYVSESSAERRARHSREAESVCESNSLALNKVLTEMESPQEKITLVGILGADERSATVNQLRLQTIRNYFVDCLGVSADRVIVREGERGRFEGSVTVYRADKRSKLLLAAKDMNICLKLCKRAAE